MDEPSIEHELPVDHEHCDACGFDGGRYDDDALLEAVRALGPQWRVLIDSAGPELRLRPEPEAVVGDRVSGPQSRHHGAARLRCRPSPHARRTRVARHRGRRPDRRGRDRLPERGAGRGRRGTDRARVTPRRSRGRGRTGDVDARARPSAPSASTSAGCSSTRVHDSQHHLDDVERGLARLRMVTAPRRRR